MGINDLTNFNLLPFVKPTVGDQNSANYLCHLPVAVGDRGPGRPGGRPPDSQA